MAAQKDVASIGKLVHYPLQVSQKPKPLLIKTEKELKTQFSNIFTEKVLDAISSQKFEELFCNYQGAMIGTGQVWVKQVGSKIGISTINTVGL